MGHVQKILGLAAFAAASFGIIASADAGRCKGRHCKPHHYEDGADGYRFITTEGYGTRIIAAPVRRGRWGDEVRLPGGNWQECETSCEYTLRRWTVDFWDWQTNKSLSPGYFRFDLDLDTGHISRRGYY